jgi:hypothetical protein
MTVLSSDGWSFGCPDRVFDSTEHDAVSLGAVTALDPNVNADARTAQRNQAAGRVCARTAHHQTADAHATDRPDGPSRGNRHWRRSVLKRIAKALDVDVTELLK